MHSFVDLLLAINGEALKCDDRIQYINALYFTEDSQAISRVHHLQDRAPEGHHR